MAAAAAARGSSGAVSLQRPRSVSAQALRGAGPAAGGSGRRLAALRVQCVSSPRKQPLSLTRSDRRMLAAKRFFQTMWNDSDISILDQVASRDVIHSDKVWCEYELAGIERVRKLYTSYMAGYPDCHYDITSIGVVEMLDMPLNDQGASDQGVMVHWNFRGTNLGELWDAPATGRHTKYSGVHVLKFDHEDRIKHVETYRQPSEDERRKLSFCWTDERY